MVDNEGNSATLKTTFIVEVAKKFPLTLDTLEKQIGKLGNTIFYLKAITVEIDKNAMVPVSELNEVRRKVIQALESQRLAKFKKNFPAVNSEKLNIYIPYHSKETKLVAQIDTLDKLSVALNNGADAILYGGENFCNRNFTSEEILQALKITHSVGKNFYLATPRIVRDSELEALKKFFTIEGFDAIYIHNLSILKIVRELNNAPIHTDFSMIVFNNLTINFLKHLGVKSVTLSPELTLTQIKKLVKVATLPVECIVHGRTELMISSYCLLGSFLGKISEKTCSHVCKKNNFYLRDRKNILFPIVTDQFCRMHILNSKITSMIDHRLDFEGVSQIRVDCRTLNSKEIKKTLRAYKFGGDEITNFTRGHYFRGITSLKNF